MIKNHDYAHCCLHNRGFCFSQTSKGLFITVKNEIALWMVFWDCSAKQTPRIRFRRHFVHCRFGKGEKLCQSPKGVDSFKYFAQFSVRYWQTDKISIKYIKINGRGEKTVISAYAEPYAWIFFVSLSYVVCDGDDFAFCKELWKGILNARIIEVSEAVLY